MIGSRKLDGWGIETDKASDSEADELNGQEDRGHLTPNGLYYSDYHYMGCNSLIYPLTSQKSPNMGICALPKS